MRWLILVVSSLALLSCDTSLQPEFTEPIQPVAAILDGGRQEGNPGFFWLPPIVKDMPSPIEALDEEVLPLLAVEICAWTNSACVGDPVSVFTSEGIGPEELLINVEEGEPPHFRVVWNMANVALGTFYRISVCRLDPFDPDFNVLPAPVSEYLSHCPPQQR